MSFTDINLKNLNDSFMSYTENSSKVLLQGATIDDFAIDKTTLLFNDNIIEITGSSENVISEVIIGQMDALNSVALRFFNTYNVSYTYNLEHRSANLFILSVQYKVTIYS